MNATFARNLSAAELGSLPEPSKPRVLSEEMAMPRDYLTGVKHLDDAHAHWLSLKDSLGNAPEWSAFKPFKHPKLLPHIMLYQRVGDRYRCSIVGETAGEFLPVKLAGTFLDDVMPSQNLSDMERRFGTALETATPNFVEKTMAWKRGFDRQSYRALQLPFPGQDGSLCRLLSVMDFRIEQAWTRSA